MPTTASNRQKIHSRTRFLLKESALRSIDQFALYKWAIAAAASANEARNWAVCNEVCQAEDPVTNFSGTTSTSPGCIFVFNTPPENKSLVPPEDTTEPLARIT